MNKPYALRVPLIFVCFLSVGIYALWQLFSLQIYQHDFYTQLAYKQRTLTLTRYPDRGLIYDRNGIALCNNKETVAACIEPKKIIEKDRLLTFLQKHFESAYERYLHNPAASFLYIKRNLTEEEIDTITHAQLPDIHLIQETTRSYYTPEVVSITGITSREQEGLFGLEWLYNKELKGTPSITVFEKDAHSHFFSTTEHTQETTAPLYTTIDAHLQQIVQEELNNAATACNAQEGALIIMNPETGEILASASYPTYQFNSENNDTRCTKNNCFSECYEFGSVMKSFTALAALEEEVVTPDEVINCHNTKEAYIKNRLIRTVHAQGYVTFSEIIQHSNNIGIAIVAYRLYEKLYDYYKLFGFGSNVSSIFPGQQKGFVNPPSHWSAHSIISLSYGYEITATLVQLVRAFSLFANDGHLITPHIIKQTECMMSPKIVSSKSINESRSILEKTTTHGTARRAHIPGYTILSKTGTANLLVNGKYEDDKRIYSYVGLLEKGTYKRATGLYLKNTSHTHAYASTVVTPVCKNVMEKMVIHEHQISSNL